MAETEPIVFLNGELVPESQAGIPIRDRGFIYGDAVFDAARTFNGVPFKLAEHVKRLYDSLRYVRIDPGIGMGEMEDWSRKVVQHNYPLLPPGQDMWVMQRITRGVEGAESAPTVLIETHAIPFVARAPLYRDGARVTTPSVPRVPPRFMSPRAKTHNYLNLVLGDLEAQGTDPGSWAVLLDEAGNLTEGRGSNIFLVKDGTVATPKGQYVLEGITRRTVLDLADELAKISSLPLYRENEDKGYLALASGEAPGSELYRTYGEILFNNPAAGGTYNCARCHTYGWSFDATIDGDDSIDGHAGPILDVYNVGGGFFGPNLTGGSTLDQFETAGLHADFISAGQSIGQTYGRGGSGGNGQMPGFGPRTDDDLEVTYPATLTQDQIDAIVAFERNL